jgi:hypothetical protein
MVNRPVKKGATVSNKAKLVFVGGVAAVGAIALIFWLLQPDEEFEKTLNALNNYAEIREHNGHVEKVTWVTPPPHPQSDGGQGDRRGGQGDNRRSNQTFEADVLDDSGNVIGKVRGSRAEEFGTSVRQTRWKDKGEDLNAPWPERQHRTHNAEGGGEGGGHNEQRGEGHQASHP